MKAVARFILMAVCILVASGVAVADPTFPLANTNGGDGYVVGTLPTFQLFGANNAVGSNYTTYTATYASPTTVSFDWNYVTHDCCGSGWDPAGYVLDGVFTQLSTTAWQLGQIDSSGSLTLNLNAGDTFGWYVYSIDSVAGRGELDVTTSGAVTPEPGTMLLLGSGLAGLAGLIRKKLAK